MSSPIALSEVVRLPAPGMGGPVSLQFAPDGRTVTYLADEKAGLQRVLWAWDPEEGEPRVLATAPGGGIREGALSIEEQLRRERLRERGLGISRYAWSKQGGILLVPLGGEVWVQHGLEGPLARIAEGARDPQLSRDGTQVAFVHDDEIYLVATDGRTGPRQLTHGARGTGRTHGLAEYIAQEEMDRHHGLWWSHDGRFIAFTEVDESHLPVWRIVHQGAATPTWEDHRYPFPGADNARVSLWVIPTDGSSPARRVSLATPEPWEYLARVRWLADGSLLLAAVQDRRQQRLDLLRIDPETGRSSVVRTDHSDVWINLHHLMRPLTREPGAWLWATEETGFQHLVRIGADGAQTVLTSGDWRVDSVVHVDEGAGQVYVMATEADPRERHLYAVALDGRGMTRLTAEPGVHTVVMAPDGRRFLDAFSSIEAPEQIVLRRLDGEVLAELPIAPDPRLGPLALDPPELVTFEQRDGVALHGALYRPVGTGPWPLVISIYGGPHAQRVHNEWGLTADLKAQHLRREGFAVLKLDNRGSARRGLAFEAAIRGDLGHLELLDHVDAVQDLVEAGIADPHRVGIYGWSYGGYLSAMALARFPDVFHVAVAGAPVTHWDSYDTHYTERYMGLPSDNPHGYEISSVMHHVDGLTGDLMLIHGMLDENVHFRHTARLIDALVKAGKDVTLQIYPSERHGPRDDAGRLYVLEREMGFVTSRLRAR